MKINVWYIILIKDRFPVFIYPYSYYLILIRMKNCEDNNIKYPMIYNRNRN